MPASIEETIRRLDAEVGQRPGYAAYLYRAGLLLAAGRLEEAMRDCEAAMRLRPRASRPLFMRAELLRRLGREAEAQEAMAQARRLPRGGDGFEEELRQVLARIEGGSAPHPRPSARPPLRRRPPRSNGTA